MAHIDDSRPFAEAALWYGPYRPPYAAAAIDYLSQALGLDRSSRVLDLGCGPGILTVPIARRVAEVVALDPEPVMLAQGRERAAGAGAANITWVEARAETIGPALGVFRGAVMGQSFHWMERDLVLSRLAPLLVRGGALALVGWDAPRRGRPVESWEPIAQLCVEEFLGREVRHRRANPQEPTNEPALQRSPAFGDPEFAVFEETITRDVGSVLGCLYSMSFSAPGRFGARRVEFETELTRRLTAIAPDGRFVETIVTEVTIARRTSA
ncbi:MAG TPA: class I SAM-dependent methyltransferase [Caulobacteraceae bacterium]|jgi:SAM-dependent methyltransferase|nr:class I SAM-dependent methyltransferase [Caulobacteraceae bacterium]